MRTEARHGSCKFAPVVDSRRIYSWRSSYETYDYLLCSEVVVAAFRGSELTQTTNDTNHTNVGRFSAIRAIRVIRGQPSHTSPRLCASVVDLPGVFANQAKPIAEQNKG